VAGRRRSKQNESDEDISLAFVINVGTITATEGNLGESKNKTQIGFVRQSPKKKSSKRAAVKKRTK
jgi:hypothetical protein